MGGIDQEVDLGGHSAFMGSAAKRVMIDDLKVRSRRWTSSAEFTKENRTCIHSQCIGSERIRVCMPVTPTASEYSVLPDHGARHHIMQFIRTGIKRGRTKGASLVILHPQATRAIGAGTDAPRLARVPIDVHDTEGVANTMTLEDLDRDNGGVFNQVADDLAVEDLQGAVVAGVGKEGQAALVEAHGTNGLVVEAHRLVGPGGQVEIVPEQAAIVGADDEIVSAGVHVKGRDPAGAGLDDLDKFLSLQVVAANGALCGDEEERARRVEGDALCEAGEAAEGDLRQVLRQCVDGDGRLLTRGRHG